jgi:rod shape determining protein RodA
MMMQRRGRIDKVLLGAAVAVSLLGVLFVNSATWDQATPFWMLSGMALRQLLWVVIGFAGLFIAANMDYRRLVNYAYPFYLLSLAALVFLLVLGGERYGARRWVSLGPLSVQPSEFLKITVILALAYFLGERREKRGSFGNFAGSALIVAPGMLLIFLQPDLGTALVLVPILFACLFISGEKIRYIAGSMISGLVMMPVFWGLLKDYQRSRLLVFINPDLDPLGAGYTIIQSKIAIGSGGLFGKGLFNGTQNYLRFLPERHTDFIFSVIGEEWGLAGAILVVGLFSVIVWRGLRIVSSTKDVTARVIAIGVVTLLAFQVFVNVSMTIGFMPVVGLPLPAISYGGSNTVATLIGIGLLLGVSRKAEI